MTIESSYHPNDQTINSAMAKAEVNADLLKAMNSSPLHFDRGTLSSNQPSWLPEVSITSGQGGLGQEGHKNGAIDTRSIQKDDDAFGPDRRFPLHNLSDIKPQLQLQSDRAAQTKDAEPLHLDKPENLKSNDALSKQIVEAVNKQPAKEYQVKAGDSLWKIAHDHLPKGASQAEILKYIDDMVKLNGWKDRTHPIYENDRIKIPSDGKEETKPDSLNRKEAHDRLEKLAEEKFKNDPARLAEFKENMRRFEERAAKDGLSDAEIAKTYGETCRLLEARGNQPLTSEQRDRLAEQIIRQAADPTSIDQGFHNTCNMATVESRMYTRNPSEAARLVADVALTGQYVTKDGMRIRVNPHPHDTARDGKINDGDRSHASEIFQVTAVNIHLEIENRKTHPRGQLRYEQQGAVPGSGDTGERVIDYGKNPPVAVDNHPEVYGDNLGNLRDVYSSITGVKEKGIIIGHEDCVSDQSDGVVRVKSEKELNDALAEAKRTGKLPLIVSVDTNMEPFWSDSGAGAAGGAGGKHVVTITDYNPGPPATVAIDNQWGKGHDHDAAHPISVHELYGAMRGPKGAIEELDKDVKTARDAGHPDLYKETELARLKHREGQMNDEDYEKELIRLSRESKNTPDANEQEHLKEKLRDAMHDLPPAHFFRVLKEQKSIGLLNDDEYIDGLKGEAKQMDQIRKDTIKNGTYARDFKQDYENGVKELMKLLDGLTPEQIQEIRDALKGNSQ